MSSIIKRFTFERNSALRTAELSYARVLKAIEDVSSGSALDKTASNKVGTLASYMGLFSKGAGGKYRLTPLAEDFLTLYGQDRGDAWRWLLTRSLWLYVVPNGIRTDVNDDAKAAGVSFSFFRLLLQILRHLEALPNEQRFLYYDEFCAVMEDDANWGLDAVELVGKILNARTLPLTIAGRPSFLRDLEVTYDTGKDNLNGLFHKQLSQTGLFDYVKDGSKTVGIALSDSLDGVLQRRVRFVIDNPSDWNGTQPWNEYMARRTPDLPLEVTLVREEPPLVVPTTDISDLVEDATVALNDAGLRVESELVRRYLAALFTKPFVVLSGLTGSGKTKLAQLVAQWLDSPETESMDAFPIGTEIPTGKDTYTVSGANDTAITLLNGNGKLTPLPRGLIDEWAGYIAENNIGRETSADAIRDAVKLTSDYVSFIHSSSSLKALAFYLLDHTRPERKHRRYEVVPVEANWTSADDVFGYADALDDKRYSRRPALDLVLRARTNYETADIPLPYFLILDEMNLSHVERYFATILSALESDEAITLHGDAHDRDGVPAKMSLPPNLFIIGTINVDETTYQFSPKVLDRANVMEFRVSEEQMSGFLKQPKVISSSTLAGEGAKYAAACVATAEVAAEPDALEITSLEDELMLFYTVLADQGAEFGFRTAKEIGHFIQMHKLLNKGVLDLPLALDAQVLQKILPKLHGSQRKLEPLLRSLAVLCHEKRGWRAEPDPSAAAALRRKTLDEALAASDTRNKEFDPLTAKAAGGLRFTKASAYLPLSFEKVVRMLVRVGRDGFTSFAEA